MINEAEENDFQREAEKNDEANSIGSQHKFLSKKKKGVDKPKVVKRCMRNNGR
jgi:hypothetical protein